MGRQRTGVDRILSLPNSYSIPLFYPSLIPTPSLSFTPPNPNPWSTPLHSTTVTSPLIYPSLHHNFTPKPPNPLHPIPHPITIPHLRPPRSSPHCRHASRTLFLLLYSNIKILLFFYIFSFKGKKEYGWYRGGFDDDGKPHGLCRRDYDNGGYSIGEYNHDSRCGHWIVYNKDGSISHEWDY